MWRRRPNKYLLLYIISSQVYSSKKKKNEIVFTKVEIIELKKVKSNLIVFDSLLIVCFRLGI